MRRKNLKKKDEMSMDRKRGLFEEMGMRKDYKTRQAMADFRRPAFEGTALEARRQRVTATPEGSRVAPPIIYHDESDLSKNCTRLSIPALRGRGKEKKKAGRQPGYKKQMKRTNVCK